MVAACGHRSGHPNAEDNTAVPLQHLTARHSENLRQPVGRPVHQASSSPPTPPLHSSVMGDVACVPCECICAADSELQNLRDAAARCGTPFSAAAATPLPLASIHVRMARKLGASNADTTIHDSTQCRPDPLVCRPTVLQPGKLAGDASASSRSSKLPACRVRHAQSSDISGHSYLYDAARPATVGMAPFEWDMVRPC